MTRNTFDINAIPLLKELSHLPVVADPSHGTGISSIVTPVTHAAIASGCDGIMVEVHNDPACALCDGQQAVDLNGFAQLMLGAREYEKIRCIYNNPYDIIIGKDLIKDAGVYIHTCIPPARSASSPTVQSTISTHRYF